METQLKIFKFHDNKVLVSQNTEFFLYMYTNLKAKMKINTILTRYQKAIIHIQINGKIDTLKSVLFKFS